MFRFNQYARFILIITQIYSQQERYNQVRQAVLVTFSSRWRMMDGVTLMILTRGQLIAEEIDSPLELLQVGDHVPPVPSSLGFSVVAPEQADKPHGATALHCLRCRS